MIGGSPGFNVAIMLILLVCVSTALRFLKTSREPAQIEFRENQTAADQPVENNYQAVRSQLIFGGEVYQTTVRLREASAVGMAVSVAILQRSLERKGIPPSLREVQEFLQSGKLLPPGIEFEDEEISSPDNRISVRYRLEPLAYEIVAVPKGRGPAIMIRFPLISLDGRMITFFQSPSEQYTIPAPFIAADALVSGGWTLEQWRGDLLPKPVESERFLEILNEEKRLLEVAEKQR